MHVDRLDRLVLHVDVPDAQRQVVARQEVPTVFGELDVRHGRDDLAEERLGRGVLLFFEDCARGGGGGEGSNQHGRTQPERGKGEKERERRNRRTLGMLVAQGLLAHVGELDGAL